MQLAHTVLTAMRVRPFEWGIAGMTLVALDRIRAHVLEGFATVEAWSRAVPPGLLDSTPGSLPSRRGFGLDALGVLEVSKQAFEAEPKTPL